MDTIYRCRKPGCRHTLTVRAGELTTANVKTHCGLVMQAHRVPTTLEEAQPGDLVAIKGAWNDPYWRGTVAEVHPQRGLLRVVSERFEGNGRQLEQHWYNHQGQATNPQGKPYKRVGWDVGSIEPLTEHIRQQLLYQEALETLTGFRTWHYGLLKDATLDEVRALIGLLQQRSVA